MDWKQIIADLTSTGLTQSEIAARTQVGQSAISELATGATKEPKFSTGQKLSALHRRVTRAQRELRLDKAEVSNVKEPHQ